MRGLENWRLKDWKKNVINNNKEFGIIECFEILRINYIEGYNGRWW